MTPVRIQRKRTKGWRMPENTIYVGRPTKWGNPFRIGSEAYLGYDVGIKIIQTRAEAVQAFRLYAPKILIEIQELQGKNLACWCPLDKACHADVLLELANQ